MIKIESLKRIEERKIKEKIKADFEKYLKDPVFMTLVKKYAKESEEFNKNKPAIEKEHDKIIKRVFTSKREAARFIRKTLKIDVKAKDLELVQNSFVTLELKYREADIVYKIKGTNVVILIEHQTRVDKKMPYRILNYQMEIMRTNEGEEECLVIPIVLYTGKEPWTAKRYIREIQDSSIVEDIVLEKMPLGLLGYYTLVDVNKYTKEELLEEEGILSKIMLLEKERNTEELLKTIFKINEKIKEVKTKEKEIVYVAMEVLLGKKIGKEKAEEIMKKIIEEGSDYMLAAEEMIIEENEMIRNEGRILGRTEGISIGEARGREKGISIGQNNIIKILFKNKMTPKEISEKTGIDLSEILRIVK